MSFQGPWDPKVPGSRVIGIGRVPVPEAMARARVKTMAVVIAMAMAVVIAMAVSMELDERGVFTRFCSEFLDYALSVPGF